RRAARTRPHGELRVPRRRMAGPRRRRGAAGVARGQEAGRPSRPLPLRLAGGRQPLPADRPRARQGRGALRRAPFRRRLWAGGGADLAGGADRGAIAPIPMVEIIAGSSAPSRALTSPALLSRPLPPHHTGRGGRTAKRFSFSPLPVWWGGRGRERGRGEGFGPLSPGVGGREGAGERGLGK